MTPAAGLYRFIPEIILPAGMHRFMTIEASPVLDRDALYLFDRFLHGDHPFLRALMAGKTEFRLVHRQVLLAGSMIAVAHSAGVLRPAPVDIILPVFRGIVLMAAEAQLLTAQFGAHAAAGEGIMALFALLFEEGAVAVRTEEPLVARTVPGMTVGAILVLCRSRNGNASCLASRGMAILAYFNRSGIEMAPLRRAVGIMTRAALASLEGRMHIGHLQLIFQLLVAAPAEVLFRLDEEMLVRTAMGEMAVGAGAFLQRTVHEALLQEVPHILMTAQTEAVYFILHQTFVAAHMHIVTDAALSLLEREMHVFIGHALLELRMAFEAHLVEIRFYRGAGNGGTPGKTDE